MIAIAKTNDPKYYITPNRRYVAREIARRDGTILFSIVNDNLNKIDCLNQNCGHLNGANWDLQEWSKKLSKKSKLSSNKY